MVSVRPQMNAFFHSGCVTPTTLWRVTVWIHKLIFGYRSKGGNPCIDFWDSVTWLLYLLNLELQIPATLAALNSDPLSSETTALYLESIFLYLVLEDAARHKG